MPDDRAISPTLVHIDAIQSVPAISALGLVAARMLQQHGTVTLQVSEGGVVEVVPDQEMALDVAREDVALQHLIDDGYTDQQLSDFLRMREVRRNRRDNTSPQDDHR